MSKRNIDITIAIKGKADEKIAREIEKLTLNFVKQSQKQPKLKRSLKL